MFVRATHHGKRAGVVTVIPLLQFTRRTAERSPDILTCARVGKVINSEVSKTAFEWGAGLLPAGESSQSVKTLTALADNVLVLMSINCRTGFVRTRFSLNFNQRILLLHPVH